MSKFERKFGKYAIRNLSLVLIICYGIGYIIQRNDATIALFDYFTLNPYLILQGQIWRLVTWILIPPQTGSVFSLLIMMLFYYSVGTTLERTWGTYRYNVYIFSGFLFTIIGSFVGMGIGFLFYGDIIREIGAALFFQMGALCVSTYYVNMSIFLAFAATFPEAQVLLMFIIPIKVKWMGIVYAAILMLDFVEGSVYVQLYGEAFNFMNMFYRLAMVASLANFIVFFITSRRRVMISPKQMKRRQEFKAQVKKRPEVTMHKCAICGRTDESNPELEFRFCSKCEGNYEYCQDHLFTHQHVAKH